MRRRTQPPVVPALAEPVPPAAADRIAGFRVVRRLADGDRATLHLVADEPADESADERVTGAGHDRDDTAARAGGAAPARLAVLRLYDAAADQHAIAVEVEAMSEASALPRLVDLAVLPDGRTCLFVERLAGASLAQLLLTTRFAPGEAVTILAPIAVALSALERRGLAHSRLSAADVLFDEHGRPRIIGTGALVRAADLGGDGTAWTATVRHMHEAFAALIDDVAAATRPAGALAPVASLLRERLAARPFRSCMGEIERMLFAVADPLPVGAAVPAAGSAGAAMWEHAERDAARQGARPTAAKERAGASGARDAPGAAARGLFGRFVRRILGPAAEPRGPARVGSARVGSGRVGSGQVEPADAGALEPARMSPSAAVLDAEFGVGGAVVAAWRSRVAALLRRHRPKIVVAGLVGGGALVLLLTLVPPGGDGDGGARADAMGGGSELRAAAQEGGTLSTKRAPDGEGDRDGEGDGPRPETATDGLVDAGAEGASAAEGDRGTAGEDPVGAAARLLGARAECFGRLDLSCLDDVVDPGSTLETADRATIAAGQQGDAIDVDAYDLASARLTGTMGDAYLVAVPFAAAEREPASVLLMRTEAGWRLREIFD